MDGTGKGYIGSVVSLRATLTKSSSVQKRLKLKRLLGEPFAAICVVRILVSSTAVQPRMSNEADGRGMVARSASDHTCIQLRLPRAEVKR